MSCVAHESEFRNRCPSDQALFIHPDHFPQQPHPWWQRGAKTQPSTPPAAKLNNIALIEYLPLSKLMPVPEANGARDGDEDRGQHSPSPDLSRYDFHAPPRLVGRGKRLCNGSLMLISMAENLLEKALYHTL